MITDINVTPMVDILLVLLVIFMVTATYIVRDSLEVKLPEASTGEPKKVTILALTLDAKGVLALNGQAVTEAEVRAFIAQYKAKGKRLEAIIAADKDVSHGKVVRLIDLVRKEGVIKFAINVLRPQGAK
ncbi:MAG: biopolymer transporter ExbD [Deltaproteobacteria bacterium]|nr:biopolymer transporter ExbD [Deltaproteobacteria bacterium]